VLFYCELDHRVSLFNLVNLACPEMLLLTNLTDWFTSVEPECKRHYDPFIERAFVFELLILWVAILAAYILTTKIDPIRFFRFFRVPKTLEKLRVRQWKLRALSCH
jgi:hypothetical protein